MNCKTIVTLILTILAFCGGPAVAQVVIDCDANGYKQNFDSGNGNWTTSGTLWQHGAPSAPGAPTPSGVNAWATNLNGNYGNGVDETVDSPVFDCSGLAEDPTLSFSMILDTEAGDDGVSVELSIDGAPFTTVGSASDPNWYNQPGSFGGDSGGVYDRYHNVLVGAAGSANVVVRFRFTSDAMVNDEGVAFDDVQIVARPTIILDGPTYFADFEAGPGGWCESGAATNTVWQHGIPNSPGASPPSGVNAWTTRRNGNYPNNANENLHSPIFDCSMLIGDPVLSLALHGITENGFDYMAVEISIDGGSYTRLGSAGDPDWYTSGVSGGGGGFTGNLPGTWKRFRHALDGAAGHASVRLRFKFVSDSSVTAVGYALDDVKIETIGTLPGTFEGLFNTYAVNGGAATVAHFGNDVFGVAAADVVSVGHDSSDGDWYGIGEFIVLGSLDLTGATPLEVVPNLYLGGLGVFLITSPILGPVPLTAGGYHYGFVNPGGGFAGVSLFLQALVIDASAANGNYASSDVLEVQLN